jgi:hypothetical protein
MQKNIQLFTLTIAVAVLSLPAVGAPKKSPKAEEERAESAAAAPAVLWRNPEDITSRNLFYGPGGEKDQPHGPFKFVKEDLDGSNPKFVARDRDDVKWKVKLGEEARPETVASRIVWAVGYFANEDYFLPELQVADMPRLKRGQNRVLPGGIVHDVRLKRYVKGEEKVGDWAWKGDPFSNTRELNGLKVTMALINNWDLKDENNHVYAKKGKGGEGAEQVYIVSDLGASFGSTGFGATRASSKGNLHAYTNSRFITKVTPEFVDFKVPSRPALIHLVYPPEFIRRLELRSIGKNIPRGDARWIGDLLAKLSPEQIRDAFRAAGYAPQEVEAFSEVVESRIAELEKL